MRKLLLILPAIIFLTACPVKMRLPEQIPEPPREEPVESAGPEYVEMAVPDSEDSTNSDRPLYRVWYGTNREPIDPRSHQAGYSNERGDRIHYGQCIVEIPKSHEFGSIGSSWMWRFITWTDDRIKLDSIVPMTEHDFFQQLRDRFANGKSGERNALVYIHGFNVGFEDAAIRAAQIGFDLKVKGVTAFFSWPSKNSTAAYAADVASIEATEDELQEFLLRVLEESDAEEVHIIAHSMGNRGLLRAMERIVSNIDMLSGKRFGQIFLAAPDVDIDLFERLASVYPQVSKRTTLYISSKDLALRSSGIIHDHPRAGFYPPVTSVRGIDTVQVSNIDITILGHSYYAEAKDVLFDMYQLLQHNSGPDDRIGLKPVPNSISTEYWEILP